MESGPVTFALLVITVVIWWFAVLGIAGNRFGLFHWVPVAIASFAVPMMIADTTFQDPQLEAWLRFGWDVVGILLASVYFIRRRIIRSR